MIGEAPETLPSPPEVFLNTQVPIRPVEVLLAAGAILSTVLLALALHEIKINFNPADWINRYSQENRLHVVDTWDLEFFQCANPQFESETCRSISGPFAFEGVRLPLRPILKERFAQMANRTTHVRMNHVFDFTQRDWISERLSEEFLRPEIVMFRNARCFASKSEDICRSLTEALPVSDAEKASFVFRLNGSDRVGPQVLPPLLIESSISPQIVGIEGRARAAFGAEGIVVFLVTVFLALLALVFPKSPAQNVLFVYSFMRGVQIALSYVFESIQPDWLLLTLGETGYQATMVFLDSLILITLLYLSAVFVNRSFRISKLEAGYGLALLLVFFGVALTYTSLNELSLVSHFVRDTLATLFGAIWIIYKLLMQWHKQRETQGPDETEYLKTFFYLFFLVSYGSASAQSAIASTEIPDLLHWENLFFVPGLSLAILVDHWLRQRQHPGTLQT